MKEKYSLDEKIQMLKEFVSVAHKCEIYGDDLLDAIYASPHLSCLSIPTVCLIALNETPDTGDFFEKMIDSYNVFIPHHGNITGQFVFSIENQVNVMLCSDNIWRTEKTKRYMGYA